MSSAELKKRISALEERVRILENRVDELTNRFESFRINVINTQKSHDNKIKMLIKGTAELSRALKDLRRIVSRLEAKMLQMATRAELKEIEAYLQLLNPLSRIFNKEVR